MSKITLEDSAKKKAEYNAKYNKHNTVTILVRLNKRTESELIDYLNCVKEAGGSKSGFFKMAAKYYMRENFQKNP